MAYLYDPVSFPPPFTFLLLLTLRALEFTRLLQKIHCMKVGHILNSTQGAVTTVCSSLQHPSMVQSLVQ